MTAAAQPAGYTLARVQEMLGLSRSVIGALVRAGFVQPARGPGNAYCFSFHDLLLLRTAHALQRARIPPRRILAALRKLRATLPQELPLAGMRITAVGSEVAVHDAGGRWAAESGQLLMDFEVAPAPGGIAIMEREPAARPADGAAQHLARGIALEKAHDRAAAEAAYRDAVCLAPDYVDAYLNLGALLCETRRCGQAVQLYGDAVSRCAPSALLHFNQALALEGAGNLQQAAETYRLALALDADLADAHYNLARLQEQLGDGRAAVRHFNAYRRLNR